MKQTLILYLVLVLTFISNINSQGKLRKLGNVILHLLVLIRLKIIIVNYKNVNNRFRNYYFIYNQSQALKTYIISFFHKGIRHKNKGDKNMLGITKATYD